MATLSRDGSGYQISNRRSFDAWGSVRLGSQTGDPSGRYCANLGHKQDDESGLVYMRARYYEPTSGRFVSQDPAMDGWNWFIFCRNNAVDRRDYSGKWSDRDSMVIYWSIGVAFTMGSFACALADNIVGAVALAQAAVISYIVALDFEAVSGSLSPGMRFFALPAKYGLSAALETCILSAVIGARQAKTANLAMNAIGGCFAYAMILIGVMAASECADSGFGG